MSRILLIRVDGIGDLAMSLAIFPALRRRFPEARITVDAVPIKTEGMPTVRGYSVLPIEVRRGS